MSESIRKQTKEEQRKAARKAEKAAKKAANVAKVEATKAEKEAKAKANKPKPIAKVEDTGPVVRKVKDIWEALDLEKKGIHVNENGEYTIDTNAKGVPTESGKKKVKRAKHPLYRKSKGHGKMGRVCVITKAGDHVRVTRTMAETLVAEGGRYIAKWEFKGKVNGETVDWSSKK
jgi:hypothetical protein